MDYNELESLIDVLADGYLRNEGTNCAYVACRTDTKPNDGTDVGNAWGKLREARSTVIDLIAKASELEALKARIEAAPVAEMNMRLALGLCALTEDDFPDLYALQGQRVRLLAVEE